MERIRKLNGYQKAVLAFLAVMLLAFTALYPVTIAREGFRYGDALLIPREEWGKMAYSGRIRGEEALFTVDGDGAVEFRYGDRDYGPYTVREDPSALPEEGELRLGGEMTGIEVRRGEEVIFRGGLLRHGGARWLYNEDGSLAIRVTATMSDGTVIDENGREIDPMEPSVGTILSLMAGPELTHKGEGAGWFGGVFFFFFDDRKQL